MEIRMFDRIAGMLVLAMAMLGLCLGSVAYAHTRHHSKRHHRHHHATQKANSSGDHTSGYGQRPPSGCERYGAYSPWDEEWLKMSIEGDRFEIKGGEIAQRHTDTSIVRALGQRLIKDHTKSLDEAADEAREHGIEVPDSPSPTQEWELDAISHLSGHTFDHWYSYLEVKDHIQDIEETKAEIEKGCDEDIRGLAKDDLPVLEEHLRLAEQALAAVD
jgi:putative membrane protein